MSNFRHNMFGGPISGQHSRAEGGGSAHIADTSRGIPEKKYLYVTSLPRFPTTDKHRLTKDVARLTWMLCSDVA